jgi:hypothetical protein
MRRVGRTTTKRIVIWAHAITMGIGVGDITARVTDLHTCLGWLLLRSYKEFSIQYDSLLSQMASTGLTVRNVLGRPARYQSISNYTLEGAFCAISPALAA